MSDDLRRYLTQFAVAAEGLGMSVRPPGKNWVPLSPLVRGSHISLSVSASQIQVNLNNDDDTAREKFNALAKQRAEIEDEIGEGLIWDKKDGRKKTVIRATHDAGYADPDWMVQHSWGIGMMKAFGAAFGARLR